jgi:hypothetical protein
MNPQVEAQKSRKNQGLRESQRAAQHIAQHAAGSGAPDDAELGRVVMAWPDLPPAIRRAVLAMVDAAEAEGAGR